MSYRKIYFIGFVVPLLLFASCLHSRTTSSSSAISVGIKISHGRAVLKADGKLNENLYYDGIFDSKIKDEKYYDKPAITAGMITKNETKHLATGDEYKFSILPTEVVTINIRSADDNDVEVMVYQYGKEKTYTVKGTDKLGLFLAFQNR
jgi:hypothetical protein